MLPQSVTLLLRVTATLETREGEHKVWCLGRVTERSGQLLGRWDTGVVGGFGVSLANGQCVQKHMSP